MAGGIYYVYFLKSLRNSKFYTGTTEKEPLIRLAEHNNGSNQWTRQNGPFKLIYFEGYHCKKNAEEREKFYKSGFGSKIRKIILQTIK